MDAYIHQSDLYCSDCAADRKKAVADKTPNIQELLCDGLVDSDRYPMGPYPDGGGEADSPQHCGDCKDFLMNPLTEEGEKYVIRMLGGYLQAGDEELGASLIAAEVSERISQDASLSDHLKDAYDEWADCYDFVLQQEAERRYSPAPAP